MPPQSKLPAIGEEYVGALPPIGGEWVEPRQPTIAPPPQTPPPGPKPDMVKGEWDPNYSLSEKYRRALGIPHAVYDAGGTHSTVKGLLDTVDSLIQATDFKAKHGLNQIREGNYAKGGREMVQGIGTGALVASAPAIGTALRAAPLATLAKM